MARWGEGDPRWIVEEREDATNVNNWHWTEKNATPWSKQRLNELLTGFKINIEGSDGGECEITEVTSITGEATANNRKGKLIFFYEWELAMDWKGSLNDGDNIIRGKITIPNLSEENDPDDITIEFSTKTETEEAYKLKQVLIKKGTVLVQNQLGKYIKELKEEYGQNLVLPTKTTSNKTMTNNKKGEEISKEFKKAQITDANKTISKTSSGVQIKTTSFTCVEEFLTSVDELYNILTNEDRVRSFCRSNVKVNATKGGDFVLFDGLITGKFQELIQGQAISMLWRTKNWPQEHHSLVKIDLKQKEDRTELKLTQTGIPISELEKTKQGWKQYYWESIKKIYGMGLKYF